MATIPGPFTIFVSSPGDLGEERYICSRVIDRLKVEFARKATINAILWEHEPLIADASFQDQIPLPSETDIVIMMLWSRLGYRLPSRYKEAGDTEAPTGTLFEFRNALKGRQNSKKRTPDIMVYRKNAEPPAPSVTDQESYLRAIQEWNKVEDFFNSQYFRDSVDGAFTGSYHSFQAADRFEQLLTVHLRKIIERRLGTVQDDQTRQWEGSPFRGLEVFDLAHAPIFFGRARAVVEIRDALRRRAAQGKPFVLVTGPSGSGKSSLVRAGVLSGLIQPGIVPGIGLWYHITLHPAEMEGNPFAAIAHALVEGFYAAIVADLPEGSKNRKAKKIEELLRAEPSQVERLVTKGLTLAAKTAIYLNLVEGFYSSIKVVLPERSKISKTQKVKRLRSDPSKVERLITRGLTLAAKREKTTKHEEHRSHRDREMAAGIHSAAIEAKRLLSELKPPAARLALVIDQMEELFTYPHIDQGSKSAFLHALAELIKGTQVWILATLRSDFFSRCEEIPEFIDLKNGDGTYHLLPPSGAEIGQIIREPAAAAGLRFEKEPHTGESLDDVLLADALRGAVPLPLLEFTLEELYRRSGAKNGILTFADYREIGGIEGALANRAEWVFSRLSEPVQAMFDQVMLAVTTVALGERGAFQRRWADRDSLQDSPAAKEFLDAFLGQDARLFVASTSAEGQASAEKPEGRAIITVAHEALLTAWPRLQKWLFDNQESLRASARVEEGAKIWIAESKSDNFLLETANQLALAEELLSNQRINFSPEAKAFVQASLEAQRERQAAELRQRQLQSRTLVEQVQEGIDEIKNRALKESREWLFERFGQLEDQLLEAVKLDPESSLAEKLLGQLCFFIAHTSVKTGDLNVASMYLARLQSMGADKSADFGQLHDQLSAAWQVSDPRRNRQLRQLSWLGALSPLLSIVWVQLLEGYLNNELLLHLLKFGYFWITLPSQILFLFFVSQCRLGYERGFISSYICAWFSTMSNLLNIPNLLCGILQIGILSNVRTLKLIWTEPSKS